MTRLNLRIIPLILIKGLISGCILYSGDTLAEESSQGFLRNNLLFSDKAERPKALLSGLASNHAITKIYHTIEKKFTAERDDAKRVFGQLIAMLGKHGIDEYLTMQYDVPKALDIARDINEFLLFMNSAIRLAENGRDPWFFLAHILPNLVTKVKGDKRELMENLVRAILDYRLKAGDGRPQMTIEESINTVLIAADTEEEARSFLKIGRKMFEKGISCSRAQLLKASEYVRQYGDYEVRVEYTPGQIKEGVWVLESIEVFINPPTFPTDRVEALASMQTVSFKEVVIRNQNLLDKLNPREREVLTKLYLEGKSPKEIAGEMDVTKQAVSQYKTAGLRRLRELTTLASGQNLELLNRLSNYPSTCTIEKILTQVGNML